MKINIKRISIAFCLCICSFQINSQDTLKIMYYNLLDFPIAQQDRIDTLKKILNFVKPDVFVVNELTSFGGGVQIKNNALNVGGVNYYESAVFYDGPDTDNLLFYNSNKLGLVSQYQIPTVLRDISEYELYYKEPGMTSASDTTYLYFYSLHLKAGSQQNEADQRFVEAQAFKTYLDNNNRTNNLFVGGDFNFYQNTEQGCQEVLAGGSVVLNDPVNKMGLWHANFGYKAYHTQSTRMNQGYAGGAGGGMDDRFDFIFTTADILNGSSGVLYIEDTYEAFGQDGNHFNGDVHIPTNTSVPMDISSALFYMSDHLPVCMDVALGGTIGLMEQNQLLEHFYLTNNQLNVGLKKVAKDLEVKIVDLSGKLVLNNNYFYESKINMQLNNLPSGIYIANVIADGVLTNFKFAYFEN